MPRAVIIVLLFLASLALIPVAFVARSRVVKSSSPRIHIVQDMDNQGKFKAQQANPMFADRRAMRPPVEGTVAVDDLREDDRYYRGISGSEYVTEFPLAVTMDVLGRGQERFGIYCAPCHGLSGFGDGIVSKRAERLQMGKWVPPSSFHAEPALSRPPGHIFNSITNGIRNMPAYGSQIPTADRWAIVAYVKTLQRSRMARVDDVPRELRDAIRD